ncbi:MAG TPA: DUF4175 family protein, partial [Acidobacteriota bacterium]|nr:DUF4175 family protein [Acidobacteriota bacterium]
MSTLMQKPLREVRRKVQRERLIRGAAILFVVLLVGSVAATWLLAKSNFSDSAILWSRILILSTALGLSVYCLLLPLLRRPSDERIARFLEERHPELFERVSTAVQVGRHPNRVHPEIAALIQADARKALDRIQQPRFFWPRVSGTSAAGLGVVLVTFLALFFAGPIEYRYGLQRMLYGWLDDGDLPLYVISVEPGAVTVAERADLEIRAYLQGFEAQNVRLLTQHSNQTRWDQLEMVPEMASSQFSFLIFDVREPFDYFVEAAGIRSDTFRVEVSEIASIDSLEISLHFPSYTGMDPVTQEDGNIRALKGTRAEVRLTTDIPVHEANLRFDSGAEIIMDAESERVWTGTFRIERDDYYRAHLVSAEGVRTPASDEFSIEVLQDQPPSISFREPGRDRKVTNIEEVFTEVAAQDDFGLRKLQLFYSINGAPVASVPLASPRGSGQTTASYTFHLEEFDLAPGDFVSYYARAEDNVSSAVTDIYFLEVMPFDLQFFQSQQAGMPGAEGEQGLDLVRRQKQIVVATFSLVNERGRYSGEEFQENSLTLGLLQQRLRDQTGTIAERITRREAAISQPRFQKMAEYLQQAIEFMKPAEAALNQVNPEGALPHEQTALQALMRAESLLTEMQVSMSENPGEGGATAQDLADLVDLELDKTKNQYETLQQNRQQQADQTLDEAVEKLKELARRQEREVERRRQSIQGASGSAGSLSEQQLIDELERLSRELARLSRHKQDPQLSQISRELQNAARDMRQAREGARSSAESASLAQQALERMQRAQSRLDQQQRNQVEDRLNQLDQQARRIAEDQKRIVEGMRGLDESIRSGEQGADSMDQMRSLYWDKQGLKEHLQGLESELHQTARQIESREPEAARKLKEAGIEIRDQRLADKMQEGTEFMARGLTNMAVRREEGIQEDLAKLAEKIGQARQSLGAGAPEQEQERLRQALDRAGRLVEGLESLRRRGQDQQPADGESPDGEPSESASGESASAQGSRDESDASSEGGEGVAGQPRQEGAEISRAAGVAGGVPSGAYDPRQLQREWEQRLEEAQQLQQLLRDDPALARQAADLLRQMREFDPGSIMDDPEKVASLKRLII